ncbi:Dihydrosphingosine phosphate lyase [Ancistrocladus abbreviatus]
MVPARILFYLRLTVLAPLLSHLAHSQIPQINVRQSLRSSKPSLLFRPKYSEVYYFMGSEEVKDPLKAMGWKSIDGDVKQSDNSSVTKKRLPKKIRQIPECYFLPRRSLPSATLFYGSFIAAGIGAGMLLEVWINKKVKEDGGVIWEFDK